MAKRKSIKAPWGLIALVSLFVMGVCCYSSPLIAIISGAVFLIACVVLWSRHFEYLKKVASGYYDNETIEMDIKVDIKNKE